MEAEVFTHKGSNAVIAFAIFATLASCSSKQPQNQEERYKYIETEVNKEPGIFDNEREVSEKDKKMVISALEDALKSNDFIYANRYCYILENLDYSKAEEYKGKIKQAKSAILKDSLETALRNRDFTNARKFCDALDSVAYSESLEYSKKIKEAEAEFLISLNSENAVNRLIASIDTKPTKKPKIGRESESAPAYEWQSKRHNKHIDDLLDQALKNKSDILASKLLEQYVEELTYESVTKKTHNGTEYKVNVVTGFTDKHKEEAAKRYKEAKKSW